MANTIAKSRVQKCFAMKETTKGTLVAPTDAGLIIGTGYVSPNQQPTKADSKEIQDTRDVLDQFNNSLPPGTFSVPFYFRPSGSLGTAPQEDVLMECLLGTKTVNASTSVVYTPAKEKDSFSLWVKRDHFVIGAAGCSADKLSGGLAKEGAAEATLTGQFMTMVFAGTSETDAVTASAATEVSLASGEAKKFKAGAFIEFVEGTTVLNNSDAGYEISSINYTTDTLTIATGAEEEIDSGSTVRGWLPDGTEVGDPIENADCYAQLDGSSFNVKAASFDIDDTVKMLSEEITSTGYVEDFVEQGRNVSYDFTIFFRRDNAGLFYDGLNNTEKTFKLVLGDTAGSIVEIYSARTIPTVPAMQDADPTIDLKCSAKALGTSGEDSVSITYK